MSVRVWSKGNLSTLLAGIQTANLYGKQHAAFSRKLKTESPYDPASPNPGYISEENKKKNSNLKRYMHLNVYSNTIYNSQEMKAT